jgi:hypothetical protein
MWSVLYERGDSVDEVPRWNLQVLRCTISSLSFRHSVGGTQPTPPSTHCCVDQFKPSIGFNANQLPSLTVSIVQAAKSQAYHRFPNPFAEIPHFLIKSLEVFEVQSPDLNFCKDHLLLPNFSPFWQQRQQCPTPRQTLVGSPSQATGDTASATFSFPMAGKSTSRSPLKKLSPSVNAST